MNAPERIPQRVSPVSPELELPGAPLNVPLDEINHSKSYIGQSVARSGAKKLLEGRGSYVDILGCPVWCMWFI